MPTDRTTDFLRELLVRQLTTWLPAALHRSRRATIALAGADAGSAEAALRLVAAHGDQVRGRQVTVLVLADAAADLPARLGPIEAELPAEVTVHLLPGDPYRLPVAVKAAGAAGAPLFSFVDLPGAVTPKLLDRRDQRPDRRGAAAHRATVPETCSSPPASPWSPRWRRCCPAARPPGGRVRQPLRPEPGGGP